MNHDEFRKSPGTINRGQPEAWRDWGEGRDTSGQRDKNRKLKIDEHPPSPLPVISRKNENIDQIYRFSK